MDGEGSRHQIIGLLQCLECVVQFGDTGVAYVR